jgi:hypothetical protein
MELQLDPDVRGHVKRLTASLADEFRGIYSGETIQVTSTNRSKTCQVLAFKSSCPCSSTASRASGCGRSLRRREG